MRKIFYKWSFDSINSALENYHHHLAWFRDSEESIAKYSPHVFVDIEEEISVVNKLLETFESKEDIPISFFTDDQIAVLNSALSQYKKDLADIQKDFKQRVSESQLKFEKTEEKIKMLDEVLNLLEK